MYVAIEPQNGMLRKGDCRGRDVEPLGKNIGQTPANAPETMNSKTWMSLGKYVTATRLFVVFAFFVLRHP